MQLIRYVLPVPVAPLNTMELKLVLGNLAQYCFIFW